MPCRIPSSLAVSGLRSPCIWGGRERAFKFQCTGVLLCGLRGHLPHTLDRIILPRILISTILGELFSRIQCSKHQHLICQARSPIMELFFIHFSGCVFDIQLVIDRWLWPCSRVRFLDSLIPSYPFWTKCHIYTLVWIWVLARRYGK